MRVADDFAAIGARLRDQSDDQVVALLVAERSRLAAWCEAGAGLDDDAFAERVDQASTAIARLDDQISGIVAATPAGVRAQFAVLADLCRVRGSFPADDGYHGEGCTDRLIASIAAGVERLAAA